MPNDSRDRHSRRRSYSRERDRNRSRRSRSRSRSRESRRDNNKNDRKRSRSRERDRDRDRERDRRRDRENDRERERNPERTRRENENAESKNEHLNGNENYYKNKKPRIENKDSKPGNSENDKSKEGGGEEKKKIEKEKPNYQLTGKLAAEANTYNGVVLKYSEPPEARKTNVKWRFHIFKGDTQLDPLPVHRQSGYLLGRDRLVADIPIDHPSCSKQHAALQYRQVQGTDENGDPAMVVKPYLIDLNSSNGTFINGEKLEPSRYYELKQGDVVKFGFSTRDYIFIDEDSV